MATKHVSRLPLLGKPLPEFDYRTSQSSIIVVDDPGDKDMVIVKKGEKPVGRCACFNNGFTRDGLPLPLE